MVAAWATPSRHGAAIYQTLLDVDGRLSCNCPAWVYVRKGRPRTCRHTRAVEKSRTGVGRGTVVGGWAGGSPPPALRPSTATSVLTGRPLRRFDVP